MISNPSHYLVTGGAGFVGSHLVDRLVSDGHDVTVLDDLSSGLASNVPPQATLKKGDVKDHSLLNELLENVDGCFHLAAMASVQYCLEAWHNSHLLNQSAFVGLLEAVSKRKNGVIPVVYASSAAVYGNTAQSPVSEDFPVRPISVYGADKAGCELHAHAAGVTANIPTFGLRPFNIYGPRQHPSSPYSGVITLFADRIKKGEPLTIFGDGNQTRDFIFVSDVVEYFCRALPLANTSAPICNAATGKETTVNAVAQKLGVVFNRPLKIDHKPARSGDIYRSVSDISRSAKLLNFTARIEMDEGLQALR